VAFKVEGEGQDECPSPLPELSPEPDMELELLLLLLFPSEERSYEHGEYGDELQSGDESELEGLKVATPL
jgi:hypothetical protein